MAGMVRFSENNMIVREYLPVLVFSTLVTLAAKILGVGWAVLTFVLIGTLLLAYTAIRQKRRKKRSSSGLCSNCGYDLRGSGATCPECGTSRSGSEFEMDV